MRIVVCTKVIADPDLAQFDVVNEELKTVHPVPDPMDEHLLEEAMRLREKHGGEVIALSAGPLGIEVILQKHLCYGADRAIRLWNEAVVDPDTCMLSRVIEKGLKNLTFDLVLCGSESADTRSGSFVPLLANHLNLPCLSGVVYLAAISEKEMVAYKKLERGMREEYHLPLPAVVGLDPGINIPRYVAPYSRAYCRGMERNVERITIQTLSRGQDKRVAVERFCQRKPRVKQGINVATLSMQDRLRMMRGEMGDKKRLIQGDAAVVAKEILEAIENNRQR